MSGNKLCGLRAEEVSALIFSYDGGKQMEFSKHFTCIPEKSVINALYIYVCILC